MPETVMTSSSINKISKQTLPAFQQHQYAFTATIRNPEQYATPAGIEERRMNAYRELVYNNIEDLLANFFPVLKQILSEYRWHDIVREFVANHKSQTPIFMKLAEEFVGFLQSESEAKLDDPHYLIELAHYEWVEIALDIASEEPQWHKLNQDGDLLSQAPYLSPLIWPLSYDYPVHRIGPENSSPKPQATFLLVYRDQTDEVQFMETNLGAMHLLNRLTSNAQSETKLAGMRLLQQIADEMQHPEPDVVIAGGLQTLREWQERDIVLGTYK
jgi:hypothetical protein